MPVTLGVTVGVLDWDGVNDVLLVALALLVVEMVGVTLGLVVGVGLPLADSLAVEVKDVEGVGVRVDVLVTLLEWEALLVGLRDVLPVDVRDGLTVTVVVGVCEVDRDTLLDREADGLAVADGDGDGDGLHPVTTAAVRLFTRLTPPTMSTSVWTAELYTKPQAPTGTSPVHWGARPAQVGRRQPASRAVADATLYTLIDDRAPESHFLPASKLILPASLPLSTQLLAPASRWAMARQPGPGMGLPPELVVNAVAEEPSRGWPSRYASTRVPCTQDTTSRCQLPSVMLLAVVESHASEAVFRTTAPSLFMPSANAVSTAGVA